MMKGICYSCSHLTHLTFSPPILNLLSVLLYELKMTHTAKISLKMSPRTHSCTTTIVPGIPFQAVFLSKNFRYLPPNITIATLPYQSSYNYRQRPHNGERSSTQHPCPREVQVLPSQVRTRENETIFSNWEV